MARYDPQVGGASRQVCSPSLLMRVVVCANSRNLLEETILPGGRHVIGEGSHWACNLGHVWQAMVET